VILKSLLPFFLLAFSAHCFGQSSATDIIQSNLITAPEHVGSGGYFTVRTPPGLDYKIYPEPKEFFRTLEEGTGVRVLFVLYADPIDPADPEPDPKKKRRLPGYTITIDHAVIHPTPAERKAAPWDDRVAFDKWLETHSKDEVYQDSHLVKVGAGPGPGPNPPGPDPPVPPGPAPIPELGFRVLFIIDDKQDPPLSALQQAVISGGETDDYLNKTCIDEPDGQSGWRVYDKDADLSNELPVWREAHKRRPKDFKTPWVIISNGKTGTEEPLPESPSKFIELCRKYEK
jgi:hypothetical protein